MNTFIDFLQSRNDLSEYLTVSLSKALDQLDFNEYSSLMSVCKSFNQVFLKTFAIKITQIYAVAICHFQKMENLLPLRSENFTSLCEVDEICFILVQSIVRPFLPMSAVKRKKIRDAIPDEYSYVKKIFTSALSIDKMSAKVFGNFIKHIEDNINQLSSKNTELLVLKRAIEHVIAQDVDDAVEYYETLDKFDVLMRDEPAFIESLVIYEANPIKREDFYKIYCNSNLRYLKFPCMVTNAPFNVNKASLDQLLEKDFFGIAIQKLYHSRRTHSYWVKMELENIVSRLELCGSYMWAEKLKMKMSIEPLKKVNLKTLTPPLKEVKVLTPPSLKELQYEITALTIDDPAISILNNLIENLSRKHVMSSTLSNYIFEYQDLMESILEAQPEEYANLNEDVSICLQNHHWKNKNTNTYGGFQKEPNGKLIADELQSIVKKYVPLGC